MARLASRKCETWNPKRYPFSFSFFLSLLVKSDAYLTLCYTISNVLSNEFYCFIEHGESNEILVGYFIVEVVAR